jgi:hypothetical protein
MLRTMTLPSTDLHRAEAAFAAGDYARLRRELDALSAEARSTQRAKQLAQATTFDPLHAALLLASAAALTGIALYYL